MTAPSDQQILDALRTAYFQLAIAGVQSYSIFGRTLTKHNVNDLLKQIVFFETRIDAASQPGFNGGTLLVQFGNQ